MRVGGWGGSEGEVCVGRGRAEGDWTTCRCSMRGSAEGELTVCVWGGGVLKGNQLYMCGEC